MSAEHVLCISACVRAAGVQGAAVQGTETKTESLKEMSGGRRRRSRYEGERRPKRETRRKRGGRNSVACEQMAAFKDQPNTELKRQAEEESGEREETARKMRTERERWTECIQSRWWCLK